MTQQQQTQVLQLQRFHSPNIHESDSGKKKFNVYFTYQSSPLASLKQSLKIISQKQQEQKEKEKENQKRRIFQKRKFSFKSLEGTNNNKRRAQRLKIFGQPQRKKIPTLKSHIFLKDSTVSGAETIVDQLQEFDEKQTLFNPINRKLSNLKNRQITKRTFYSNTVKNSILLSNTNEQQHFFPRRNRIESEVIHYNNFSPNNKNKSSVTIKASKQNNNRIYFNGQRYVTNSVNSNNQGIYINTNYKENMFLAQFKQTQNVQTPKYHRSNFKNVKKSFQPGFIGDLQKREAERKKSSVEVNLDLNVAHHNSNKNSAYKNSTFRNSTFKNSTIPLNTSPIDRFYDQSSLQTPRLPLINKKISYEVTDPLTNSLRKQKLEKKREKQLQQQKILKQLKMKEIQQKNKSLNKLKAFIAIILTYLNHINLSTRTNLQQKKQSCTRFFKSETFFIIVIVMLSLTIFVIQLFQ